MSRRWLVLLLLALPCAGQSLEQTFTSPPGSAKPWTWWHWMNGNITREGITLDLEAMARVGIGGAEIFDVTDGILPGNVDYMSPEWRQMIHHALTEADRLGLEICLHNCAGWSSSGGPWITPALSMQIVTFSELAVRGPSHFEDTLPQPAARRGYYEDIAVLAFPTPEPDQRSMRERRPTVTADAEGFDGGKLIDGDFETHAPIPRPSGGAAGDIVFDFREPYTAQSLSIIPGPGRQSHGGELQCSDDGEAWRGVRRFRIPYDWIGRLPLAASFEPTTARYFRLHFDQPDGDSRSIDLAEVELTGGPRIDGWPGKAGYYRAGGTAVDPSQPTPPGAVDPAGIVDLTPQVAAGKLTWEVPDGHWTVLRIGHTTTGKTNHPASESGIGLECDKLSREAAKVHWEGMVGPVSRDAGPLVGRSLRHVLIDSYEVGAQNWTPRMREEFRARRGYDLLQWLPVMTGRVVGSVPESERFLWDLRRTIAELFADNYFGYFAEMCHANGLLLSVEPYGNGNFDDLTSGGRADVPMSEFWVGPGGDNGHARFIASIAHTRGLRYVGAEAFTTDSDKGGWRNHPYTLKRLGDLMYCGGINRFIFHRYCHQPWTDLVPGMTMGPHGFHFERTNTWFEQGAAWLAYLARCQHLLQEGLYVADLLYFCGENSPAGGSTQPGPPPGYAYDHCDREVILQRLTVRDGRLVLPDGMTYRLLVLPPSPAMTPELAAKIRDLVNDGATVYGPKPRYAPGREGQPEADATVRRIGDEVWADCDGQNVKQHAYGRGRVVNGQPLGEVLAALGAVPDVQVEADRSARVAWIHRRIGEAEVYFVSNQRERTQPVEMSFAVTGRAPELWRPETGVVERAPLWSERDGRTAVTLRLEPAESVFVVFRSAGAPAARALARDGRNLYSAAPVAAGKLEIRRAVYGILNDPARCVDVTTQLRAMVDQDTLVVAAENSIAGDPAPMVVKDMRVEYTLDGQPHEVQVREHGVIEIPATTGARPLEAELRVADDGLELLAFVPGRYTIATASGDRAVEITAVPEAIEPPGPWSLSFPPGLGAPAEVRLERLISWPDHPDPGVRYFSGTAIYRTAFTVPADRLGPGRAAMLDLGDVQVIARLRVNDRDYGVLWKPPFRVDVTDALRAGENTLVVEVTNLWPNRLIGDEQLPDDAEWRGPALAKWPEWLLAGTPRPETGRVTFTTWKHWRRDSALLPSGLLGPVRVLVAERRAVTTQP